jgi:hypothetical protein
MLECEENTVFHTGEEIMTRRAKMMYQCYPSSMNQPQPPDDPEDDKGGSDE